MATACPTSSTTARTLPTRTRTIATATARAMFVTAKPVRRGMTGATPMPPPMPRATSRATPSMRRRRTTRLPPTRQRWAAGSVRVAPRPPVATADIVSMASVARASVPAGAGRVPSLATAVAVSLCLRASAIRVASARARRPKAAGMMAPVTAPARVANTPRARCAGRVVVPKPASACCPRCVTALAPVRRPARSRVPPLPARAMSARRTVRVRRIVHVVSRATPAPAASGRSAPVVPAEGTATRDIVWMASVATSLRAAAPVVRATCLAARALVRTSSPMRCRAPRGAAPKPPAAVVARASATALAAVSCGRRARPVGHARARARPSRPPPPVTASARVWPATTAAAAPIRARGMRARPAARTTARVPRATSAAWALVCPHRPTVRPAAPGANAAVVFVSTVTAVAAAAAAPTWPAPGRGAPASGAGNLAPPAPRTVSA